MEWGKQIQQDRDNAKLAFYQNPGYQNERRERKSFIIKCTGSNLTSGIIDVELHEPLRIDRLSDILLENVTTFNAASAPANTATCSAYLIKINEFNHQGNSTETNSFNKLIIPNEHTATGSGRKIHKGKKLNFVTTINPTILTKITGTVTDLDGGVGTMFNNVGDLLLIEFVIVARD